MEKENIIIQYVSSWNWFLLSWIFFIGATIILFLDGRYRIVFAFVYLLSGLISLLISYYRKYKLNEWAKEHE